MIGVRDKIISAGFILALLGWLASALYDTVKKDISDNNDAINALTGLHLKGD